MKHPLLETSNWAVNPARQAEHNKNLLNMVNTGNTGLLSVSRDIVITDLIIMPILFSVCQLSGPRRPS